MRVIVVGAGLLGLTCALRLAEESYDVHVLARDLPLETASAQGALLWQAPLPGSSAREVGWAREGLRWLEGLGEEAGVRLLEGRATTAAGTVVARVPVADPAVHLPWLRTQLESRGATVTRCSLAALPGHADVVVVAAGLASRALASDDGLEPVREQVVLLDRPGLRTWVLDRRDVRRPLLVAPRGRVVVVGSALERGAWGAEPDLGVAGRLVERAVTAEPALRGAEVAGHRVLLRPWRAAARVQAEERGGRRVVHCYGHDGAGWSQAWGCAGEVLGLMTV